MSSIQYVYRSLMRVFSIYLLVVTAAPTRAELPPPLPPIPPAEIMSVVAAGGNLSVEIITDPVLDPTMSFELRYVAWDGTVVDAAPFQPADTVQKLTLKGQFAALAARGWQHQLEIVDADGDVVDLLDLRLGLECEDAASPCEVVARPGLRIDQAVAVSSALAPYLAADEPIDLGQLAQAEPALRGAIFEAAIDLTTRIQAPPTGCHCFYAVDAPNGGGRTIARISTEQVDTSVVASYFGNPVFSGSQRLEVERPTSRRVQLDFLCFKMSVFMAQQIATSGGMLGTDLPILDPCPTACSSPVAWRLTNATWISVLESEGFSGVSAGYAMNWTVGSTDVFAQGDGWSVSGTLQAPRVHSGLTAMAAGPIVVQQMPTSSRLHGLVSAEIRNWSTSDLPEVQVMAEATIKARGLAPCAPKAKVVAEPRTWGAGMSPMEITIVLGPPEDP